MPSSQPFRQLSGLLILSVIALGFVGLFGVWMANQHAKASLTKADQLSRLIESARETQIDFKTQVQLWKNILLRGQTEEGLRTYKERFAKEDAVVRDALARILAEPELPVDIRPEVESIQKDHDSLKAAYETALAAYVVGDPASVFKVDNSVRGVDQKLNARIDAVAEKLAAVREQEMTKVREEAERQYGTLRLVVSIVAIIAAVVAIVVSLKAMRAGQ